MQIFVNNPDFIVEDMLKGFVVAHPEVMLSPLNERVVTLKEKKEKVGVITGGGSGHEPAFLGYVGEGMLDAVAIGEIFASPPAQAFLDAMIEADNGRGVACLFGNYAGDNMNVKMAIQMAEDEDIEVKYVVATDDIASSPKETREKRHGIAGGYFMWKVGGAKAASCATLDEVIEVAQKVVDRTRSICVGVRPCTIPAVGTPNFLIDEGTMEFGIGHHGETGIEKKALGTADEIAHEMTEAILTDFDFDENRKLAVMISGLGSTMLMEQYVICGQVLSILKDQGHQIEKVYVGNFVTSLDMGGLSLTIVDLDEEITQLLEADGQAAGLKNY
ncbi:dihydroxyacetone kinase subunit DhaK [Enterococcus raffinosus]|uniref:dihydroxyacetone kinase subunit DhaK n=1 Tax=Enterococcus raffinosus TaxID=71452 RepID=UPI001C105172|nr:dihydroxyacetone kinase subunit DhaK [Enterococcus raffinosus]MBU5361148.1 dihydroxyacetone kinase subunit DhaK [Enterococcus raffinosus]